MNTQARLSMRTSKFEPGLSMMKTILDFGVSEGYVWCVDKRNESKK